MTYTEHDHAGPFARIATARNALLPSELRVAELIEADPAGAVELTAQELADRAGVARSTVIRTCQALGYRGYPQLRVALTREIAQSGAPRSAAGADPTVLGAIRANISQVASSLQQVASVLDGGMVDAAVDDLLSARRVLAVASGLSSPIAADVAMRLTAIGRPAECVADPIGQQIAARHLNATDVCLVISGSGANESSLRAVRAAREAGATIIAVTSFARSPLVSASDISLVVASTSGSFRHELVHTSRVAHVVLIESLVEVIASRLGETSRASRSAVLSILSDNLSD